VFGRRRSPKLRTSTIRTQKEALRWVVSVLERDGVNREELNNLRSLCTPDRFERAIELLAERAGGVTYSVEKCARVLLKIAKHAEVLDAAEIAGLKASYQEVALDFTTWKGEQVDRDQEALNNLDDSRLVDALLQLPTCTLNRVLASKRKTRGAAYAVQRALILSLWFCAPLRAGNMLGLRLDSFSRVAIDGSDWVALSVPGREVKNGEALEHFLDEDTADLLDLYLRDYRPLIAPTESPSLFPGPNGQPKTYQTFRVFRCGPISRAASSSRISTPT
jgi:integrase